MQISKTQNKLLEAKFFFRCLHDKEKITNLETKEFDFYLNAFLSAGRSVTFVLQTEQKKLYDSWFPKWKAAQTVQDQKLLNFMNGQRVEAVHRLGADVQEKLEYVPLSKVNAGQGKHPAYGFHWWGPHGITEPSIGQRAYCFEIDGTKKEVILTCKHYLEILERMMQDFASTFSAHKDVNL